MTIPNWDDLTLFHYLAIGGGVLVVLALLLYFTPLSRLKMPGVFLGILGGLALGGAVGILGATYYGYEVELKRTKGDSESANSGGGPPGPPPLPMPPGQGKMGGKGGGKGAGKGAGKGGGGGGGRGPNSRAQLTNLIGKLDLLMHKPLSLTLDAEQKKKVRELIQNLDKEKEISEDAAKDKVEEIGKTLNDEQRKTLTSAGYRWPGQPTSEPIVGGSSYKKGGPQGNPNPFNTTENKEHLNSLRAQLEAK